MVGILFICIACLASGSVQGRATECTGSELADDFTVDVNIMGRPNLELCKTESKVGDLLSVHYIGRYYRTCEIFDSSRDTGPFHFILGVQAVMPAWDEGLINMCPGEVRKIRIPSKLSYGPYVQGAQSPALIYDVELLEVTSL